MAKKKKFCAYRRIERPYTRYSKFKKKSYIKMKPVNRVVRFDMGTDKKKFRYTLQMISKDSLQIRDNALEAARQTSNRLLEAKVGKGSFKYKIRVYPHHILRENPLAAGAGADRMSTGMKASFGKPLGIAAQVKKGKVISEVSVNKEHLEHAREALRKASSKLPCQTSIKQVDNRAEAAKPAEKVPEKVAAE
jgi:large subunit ribosomal protein L10e